MATSRKLTGARQKDQTSSAEDSHARISASPEKEQDWQEQEAGCSTRPSMPFAYYDHDTSSWRTSQPCLFGGWMPFSERWPRSGMMLNGIAYRLPPLVPRISGTEFSFLHTPRANDAQKRGNIDHNNPRNGFVGSIRKRFLPTIGANEYKGASKNRFLGSKAYRGAKMSEGLRSGLKDPIYLNPYFAEVSMGFPIGWTELDALETQYTHKSQKSSAGPSSQQRNEVIQ